MEFHVVKAKAFFVGSTELEEFHARMFHGTADRGGKRPNRNNAYLAYNVDQPLQLHKNVHDMAHVFKPGGALVVSRAVRDAFGEIPGVQFAPVHFKTLFRHPYRAGDFSFHDEIGNYFQQMQFIDELKHDERLAAEVGDYFELVAPPLRDLRQSFEPLRQVAVPVGRSPDNEEIPISQQLLLRHPIYSCGAKVMSELVFEKLQPFINWTYFDHGQGTI